MDPRRKIDVHPPPIASAVAAKSGHEDAGRLFVNESSMPQSHNLGRTYLGISRSHG
jgi:hypothetical protein